MSARRWVFTQHLPESLTTAQEWWMTIPTEAKERIKYLICQTEICPSTGRRHVQGAVALLATTRMAGLKKILPDAHLEISKAWDKAVEYCKKEDTRAPGTTPLEVGSLKQGQRSDLVQLTNCVRDGVCMRVIAEEFPDTWVRNYKGLGALQTLLHPAKACDRRVALFWGPTETGKTRMVFDELQDVYTVFDIEKNWFDGYTREKNVLLDECGPGMFNHNFLKRLLDRYPMTVPIKGGSTAWCAETIIMTSNVPLSEWYLGLRPADYQALRRRMRIFEFPQDKELARAWIRGTLVPNDQGAPKRKQVIHDVEDEEGFYQRSSSPDIRIWNEPDLYDLTEPEVVEL